MANKLKSIATSQGVLNLKDINSSSGGNLKFKDTRDKRAHELKVNENPQEWIFLDIPGYRDWYRKDKILPLVKAAKEYGLPTHDFVALMIKESGLGNNPDNPSGNYTNVLYEKLTPKEEAKYQEEVNYEMTVPYENLDARKKSLDIVSNKYNILRGAKHLRRVMDKWSDRVQGLQAYRGESQEDLVHPVDGRIVASISDQLKKIKEFNELARDEVKTQEDPIFRRAMRDALGTDAAPDKSTLSLLSLGR